MRSILVIDDDEIIREMIESMLVETGYRVTTAVNGMDGVLKFRSNPVDMVITDIFMPEMDGLEIIKDLRGSFEHLKILAISGSSAIMGTNVREYAMQLGADCYLRKPFTITMLLSAVEAMIGSANDSGHAK